MTLDFALSEEHTLVKSAVRQMLQKYAPRRQEFREMARANGTFPEELWQEYASAGLMGCLVPEEDGGEKRRGLAPPLGFEEITSSGFSPGLLLVIAMDSACILKNGSEEQKQRFLPKIVDGSW